ncbi:Rv3235 family protein [Sphaerimonospora sp. CA-214678]|uniref:Rv3235 family protein n=1 Tax=Sphaerimonospora sp. CA-214678 TaxID=3240029 RepID=UPI003D8B7A01
MPKPTPRPRTALPRIMPVPPADPPYDDEREAADGAAAGGEPITYGSLALARTSPSAAAPGTSETAPGAVGKATTEAAARRAPTSPGPRQRPGSRAAAQWAGDARSAGEPQGVREARVTGDLRETGRVRRTRGIRGTRPGERHLRCLGQAMAEVLTGRRPVQTVQDKLSERAYRELVRAGKMIHAERPPMVGPPHVQWPRDGVAEMCLLVNCGTRNRVLALRLERSGVQWLVTEFETA